MSPLNRRPHSDEEFAPGVSEPGAMDRRDFLRFAGLSIAALSAAACTRQPREEIVPYVRQPEGLTPGEPRWYATAMEYGGSSMGVLARAHDGRPTKLEGNPDHPLSLGRSTVPMQAALFELYDPQRSQSVRQAGQPSTWEEFLGALVPRQARWRAEKGRGLALLTDRFTSPTLDGQIRGLLERWPEAQWYLHDVAAAALETRPRDDFSAYDLVIAVECDFLGPVAPPGNVQSLHRRRLDAAKKPLAFHVLESMPSLTGAMATHRHALTPAEIEEGLRLLPQLLKGARVDRTWPWLLELSEALWRNEGKTMILLGRTVPQEIRATLRKAGLLPFPATINPEYPQPAAGSLESLCQAIRIGAVQELVILGQGNPAYTSPADLDFPAALRAVPFSAHLGLYLDETASLARWHLPESHWLETWSDVSSFSGPTAIVQPLLEPLYSDTKSRHELLAALAGEAPSLPPYELLRASVRQRWAGGDFEAMWSRALREGIVPPSYVVPERLWEKPEPPRAKVTAPPESLELILRPDPHLWDGRFAGNPWLQELPRPMTKITWENAAHLAPATAAKEGLADGDVVEMQYRGRKLQAPVFILPGHAEGCVTLHLGGGRLLPASPGYNAYTLQFADALWGGPGLVLAKTKGRHHFATTQEHGTMESGNELPVRTWPWTEAETPEVPPDSLYPPVAPSRPAWGMTIDLDACTGCSACTIACQVENNIAVVGREQVAKGRWMHWIRVDRYFTGEPAKPQFVHQPVPCMHCENAPCEVVCPVAATVHDHQGLNLMVYNRCIGTRYCSNNCPYKVRRFNFLQYEDATPPLTTQLRRNPEVTVRTRGVMEKCTYCVQRIARAQIAADRESRTIRDGEVVPACAQACPAEAITFGDLSDPASRVTQTRRDPRQYALLGALNTRPRTVYLARRSAAPTAV